MPRLPMPPRPSRDPPKAPKAPKSLRCLVGVPIALPVLGWLDVDTLMPEPGPNGDAFIL